MCIRDSLEASPLLVLVGENKLHAFRDRPLNVNVLVIPDQSALIVWMIEIRALVSELCILGKYQEAMSKSLRNKELFLVFCGKDYTIPFSNGLGAVSYTHLFPAIRTGSGTYQYPAPG